MYYRLRGKPTWQIIDGKMVYLDSLMEARIIKRLIQAGFSKKWRRTFTGLAFGRSHYTPDIELSVLHDSMNRRALVEFKPNQPGDFPLKRRLAMMASSRYYRDALCLLYIERSRQWYLLEPGGKLQKIHPPTPGGVTINELPKPIIFIPVLLMYGRIYRSRPLTALCTITAHGLEFGINAAFGLKKR
ncbi:MAG TPA: hypothetical protein VIM37_01120 [Candidatus Microsaccharimonas sp.]|jgi:hypothetical protein